MSDTNDNTPAVWDPSARDGAGGWVRRRAEPADAADAAAPAAPAGSADEQPTALLPLVSDQPDAADTWSGAATEPFTVRPHPQYGAPGYDAPPTVPLPPVDPPPMPLFRPDTAPATPFPGTAPAPRYGPPSVPPQGMPQGVPQGVPQQWQQQPEEQPARRGGPSRRLLLAVVAALVVVGVVWALSRSGSATGARAGATVSPTGPAAGAAPSVSAANSTTPSASASPSTSASASASAGADGQAEAAAVDKLLAASVGYRQQVVDAVSAVQQCTDSGSVTAAQSSLSQAASERQTMVTQLAALDVSQIQGGAAAVQTLSRAWTESATADTDYASWAGMMAAGGCTPGNAPDTTDYDNAQAQSASATTDKNSFVVLWTPIAMQYGLPTRTADAI